jgi:hypothetical protein
MLWLGLLWLVLLFWVANLIMLMSMAIPSIFPESEENSVELVNPLLIINPTLNFILERFGFINMC